MNEYRGDIHIHTVHSPCGDWEMTPRNIITTAIDKKLDFIAITDHNSTKQAPIVSKFGEDNGIKVFMGVELTSIEEVHCLSYFENTDQLNQIQEFIDKRHNKIKNIKERNGFQPIVNIDNEVLDEPENYLGASLKASVDELEEVVHKIGGIFIPAHVNRQRYSMISQLAFMPIGLKADAVELFNRSDKVEFINSNPSFNGYSQIKNSDAHYPHSIGSYFTTYIMKEISFSEFRNALKLNQVVIE